MRTLPFGSAATRRKRVSGTPVIQQESRLRVAEEKSSIRFHALQSLPQRDEAGV
jgi:hypothetical protein